MSRARVFYLLSLLAFFATTAWAVTALPDRAATHFGPDGAADGWSTPASFGVTMGGVGLATLVLIPALMWLGARGDGRFINMPTARAKEYWTAPERISTLRSILVDWALVFSAVTALFLAAAQVATVQANRLDPPQLGAWSWLAWRRTSS
ncbi:MAG: DUF1648 domain-containing protein [Austwickia sp.]|jgi:uncharacterized membrane protein|nr:MAG: DUF1648 domain-containing protein [Austwickia sp.]